MKYFPPCHSYYVIKETLWYNALLNTNGFSVLLYIDVRFSPSHLISPPAIAEKWYRDYLSFFYRLLSNVYSSKTFNKLLNRMKKTWLLITSDWCIWHQKLHTSVYWSDPSVSIFVDLCLTKYSFLKITTTTRQWP